MIYYIAGPMRGIEYYNFKAFDDADEMLTNRGGAVVMNPAQMDRDAGFNAYDLPLVSDWFAIPDGFDFDACVERDIQAVKDCESIYMLEGWEKSTGARAEKALAEWYGKMVEFQEQPDAMRTFDTGATRNNLDGKLDYEGFLSPTVLLIYAQYMNSHRKQADGKLRDSDNWQKGIPKDVYIKSLFRHFMDLWAVHRGQERRCVETGEVLTKTELCCSIMFNVMGYLFEEAK